jgi:hypothetical protein
MKRESCAVRRGKASVRRRAKIRSWLLDPQIQGPERLVDQTSMLGEPSSAQLAVFNTVLLCGAEIDRSGKLSHKISNTQYPERRSTSCTHILSL